MRVKYLANTHFSYNLSNNELSGGSKVWKGILSLRSLLNEGVRWMVGNGKKIRFWKDKWLGGKPLIYNKFSGLQEPLKRLVGEKVGDYLNIHKNWKSLSTTRIASREDTLVKELEEMLNSYKMPLFIQDDKVI